jgi:tRNA (guanine-N7-)-methyltransferase
MSLHESMIPPLADTLVRPIAENSPSLIYRPDSYFECLDLSRLFASNRPLVIELGSGDGSFLVEYARLHPDKNFLGVERLLGRLRKIDRKGLRAGLTNLRLIRIEASYLIQYLIPAESVVALHIYFPDPWPKRKHRKHRLINPSFAGLVSKVLLPGGDIYLRTDDGDYFAQVQQVFGANEMFRPVPTPDLLAAITTDFERGFQARGIPTLRVAYQRKHRPTHQ